MLYGCAASKPSARPFEDTFRLILWKEVFQFSAKLPCNFTSEEPVVYWQHWHTHCQSYLAAYFVVCINWSTLAVHLPFSWWFPGQPTRSYSPTTWWISSIALMRQWKWLKPSFQSSHQNWTTSMLTSRASHWLCKVRTWYIYASVYLYTLEFEFWLCSKSSLDFWRQNFANVQHIYFCLVL